MEWAQWENSGLKTCQENVMISLKQDIPMTSALERVQSQSLRER
jgi:hypothetical protein